MVLNKVGLDGGTVSEGKNEISLPSAEEGKIVITTPFADFTTQDIQDATTDTNGQVWIGSVITGPTEAAKAVYSVTGAPDDDRLNREQTVGAEGSEFPGAIKQFLPLNKKGETATSFTAKFTIEWYDADNNLLSTETFDFVYNPAN